MAIDEDRLRRLEAALGQVEVPDVRSADELARHEAMRFARTFGGEPPVFRTSVLLRFHGDGVRDNDLPAEVGANVLARFVETVKAAGGSLSSDSGEVELFISPNVAAGSAVLQLFGSARVDGNTEDPLRQEILDTAVDAALGRVFEVLDSLEHTARPSDEPVLARIGGGLLGQRFFALSNGLLDGNVDLDATWQRPAGRVRVARLPREKSRRLHDLLDDETTTEVRRRESGTLAGISTEGEIGIRLSRSSRSITPMSATSQDAEVLRGLWAREVEVAWMETTVTHPQRTGTPRVTREVLSIGAAQEQGVFDVDEPPTP